MLISHPAEGDISEKLLKEHLLNVGEKSKNYIANMRLNLSIVSQSKLAEISYLIGIFHDFGKSTTYFQSYIKSGKKTGNKTRHGFFSSVAAYYAAVKRFNSPLWAMIVYLIVKNHHSDLETLLNYNDNIDDNINIAEDQRKNILENNVKELQQIYSDQLIDIENLLGSVDFNKFKNTIENFEDVIDDFKNDFTEEQQIELFFIVNLLFSILIDCDKKDAARLDTTYFDGNLEEPENDIFSYLQDCKEKEPEKFGAHIPLNQLKNQFIEEIKNNDEIRQENHFYTITAPTGIGKTFGCLAFANKLKEQLPKGEGRIIYCLPYTSIIDQNYDEFEKVIKFSKKDNYEKRPSRYLLKHHHLAFKEIKNRKGEEYKYKDYLDDKLFVESWEASMIVTTFVQFFHSIIGYRNHFLKKFHNIINSIVILDEAQNVNPHYYKLLQNIFNVLGERFNIYFLLITATQPEIMKNAVELVNKEKYMKHPLFNRVKLQVNKTLSPLDSFKENFCNTFSGENCLIVMNTKKSALQLYQHIKREKADYKAYCLTTYLVQFHRREKLKTIKEALKKKQKIIVVATQLIEAGVDISFKYVYRDFGPLDSIIQVSGRCNRNGEYGEKGGEMTLVHLKNENDKKFSSIYEPKLAQYVNETLSDQIYESCDFADLSSKYFGKFEFIGESSKLLNAIYDLNYDGNLKNQTPIKDFKLIKEYAEEDIYILISLESQNCMDNLLSYKEELNGKAVSKERKNKIFLEIEKLKGKLKDFQISLRKDEVEAYKNSDIIQDKDEYYQYIPYEKQRKYAYDEEIGFLTKPKEKIDTSVFC